MLSDHPSIAMIEIVAKGIRKVPDLDAVFVGGATTALYIDDEAIGQVRSTNDVDCTIEIASYLKYCQLEDSLRQHGFTNVVEEGAPLCRWRYEGVVVDIMPDDEAVIGFTNSWYRQGREQKIGCVLPSGEKIYIFPVEYFLASKVEAFEKRGNEDFYASKDIEDIITILDGTLVLDIILAATNNATGFLKEKFRKFTDQNDFRQCLTGHIENGDTGRALRILHYLLSMA